MKNSNELFFLILLDGIISFINEIKQSGKVDRFEFNK